MNGPYQFDPQLGYMPCAPEPFWYSGWRTLFRYRPACYQCGNPKLFKTRSEYTLHWMLNHCPPADEPEPHA